MLCVSTLGRPFGQGQQVCTGINVADGIANAITQNPPSGAGAGIMSVANVAAAGCQALYPNAPQQQVMAPPLPAPTPWYQDPLTIGLIVAGVAVVGVGAYALTR